jgi:hypothetical protein
VHAPESREGVVISRWNFGEGRLIVRGTLFTFSAHDADDLRAIQGRATTGATAAITLRDPRVGHDKMLFARQCLLRRAAPAELRDT